MQNRSTLRFHCVFVLWLAIASAPGLCAQNVQRWIHPGYGQPGAGQLDSPLFQDESQYPAALAGSDVFQFFVGDAANLGYTNDAAGQSQRGNLAARIQIFKNHGTRISIEDEGPNALEGFAWNPSHQNEHYCQLGSGVCTDDANSITNLVEQSAIKTLWKIQPIYDLGGTVSYIALDGAGIAALLANGYGFNNNGGAQYSFETAVNILVRYIQAVHAGFPQYGLSGRPEIKFGLNIAMPHAIYQGTPSPSGANAYNGLDMYSVLNTIVNSLKQANETLWFVHSDSPYNWTNTDDRVDRLVWLRNQCQGLNLRYGAIFNTENTTDDGYTNETLNYIQHYRARANGLDPDDFIIESWYATPSNTFPETTEFTFMNLVKKVADPNQPAFWGYDHRFSRQLDPDIFDWQGYLDHNPDLQNMVTSSFGNQQRLGAEWHWLNFGVNEGRRGSGRFSAPYYLNTYSDIAAAYGSQNYAGAIDHYFYAGRNEGRHGTDPNCPESSWGCGVW